MSAATDNGGSAGDGGAGGDHAGMAAAGGAPWMPDDAGGAPPYDAAAAGVGGVDGSPPGRPLDACAEIVARCAGPVVSSEPLPGRELPVVQTSITDTVRPSDIYDRFNRACGRCHAPPRVPDRTNGFWVVATPGEMLADPTQRIGAAAIERIESTDPDRVMPPGRNLSSPLAANTQRLVEDLRAWLAAGRGREGFTRQVELSGETPFHYDDELRASFTNIGACLPEPELVGCAGPAIDALDAKFARVKGFDDLPKRLEETDLFTLDSTELAKHRVISYAPTYTLFSDNAKKMRYVRVPRGQTIRYDSEKSDFFIPDNTRFYKTFLREVVDESGSKSYRKIETRLILVRQDGTGVSGERVPRAVFGTYLWSLDEARAELVEDPYNDLTPFKDLELRHVLDEQHAVGLGIDPNTQDGIEEASAIDDELRRSSPFARLEPKELLTRGYALPGRDRCVQCHMGSSSSSFILGFNPYQVDRRAGGEGGVFDSPAGRDELSQLRRFVDYGIITGLEPSNADGATLRLEESQGVRKPRNHEELKAQGYMMGNCAFCHNPAGFPSVENPSLKEVLSFYPGKDDNEGIFRFPLEKESPRTFRTPAFNAAFPYITPSVFDRTPGNDVSGVPAKSFNLLGTTTDVYIAAPWRSLIFRNVHTPFTYGHDQAIHPHMPLNVPGYDVRAPQIMADWMLSIPARLRGAAANGDEAAEDQPWEEVPESDPKFADYVEAARLRREAFNSRRIIYAEEFDAACPESITRDCVAGPSNPPVGAYLGGMSFVPDTSDVTAYEMRPERGPLRTLQPSDNLFYVAPFSGEQDALITWDQAELFANTPEGSSNGNWLDTVPDRPSWVARDLTSIPWVKWPPRNSNWRQALEDEAVFVPAPLDLSHLLTNPSAYEQERARQEARRANARRLFPLQKQFKLTEEFRRFALQEVPYGVWVNRPGGKSAPGEEQRCRELLPKARPVAEFAADETPQWFDVRPAQASERVYMQAPGEIMFNLICNNCHGQAADGDSLLAGTILELTGGETRVANLRDGLFGAEGANRAGEFDSEDQAVRYLLWMGLGGTQAIIPQVVLNRVAATRPLGEDRFVNPPGLEVSANMLDAAVAFCKDSLAFLGVRGAAVPFNEELGFPRYDGTDSLVPTNGDAELWLKLCAFDNPAPIRVVAYDENAHGGDGKFKIESAYWRDLNGQLQVPPGARFGDQRGRVSQGIRADNVLPWCVREPETSAIRAEMESLWRRKRENEDPPLCPPGLFRKGQSGISLLRVGPIGLVAESDERRDRWATRGAMNVGASVFVYLDQLAKGNVSAKPAHNACAWSE